MKARGAMLLASLVGCRPELGPDEALVSSPRILAVRADPPEAKPGTPAIYTALVASPDAADAAAPIVWRWCVAPKPLAENNVVSGACFDASSLVAAGSGPSISVSAPGNACALFGPDTPPGGFRPRDPDVTGGYYQPLRLDLPGAPTTFVLARILCNLADAPPDLASEYARRYLPNSNPHLLPLDAIVAGAPARLDAVPPGAQVQLEASWPAGDVETYAYFDRASQALTSKREAMRVTWHASAGILESESTGRSEGDPSSRTGNVWTAPAAGGGSLWLVLSDSRGGVDFAVYRFDVRR